MGKKPNDTLSLSYMQCSLALSMGNTDNLETFLIRHVTRDRYFRTA